MSEKQVHKCPKKVYIGGSMLGHVCGSTAKHEHEGVMFCKLHHPPTVKAKDEARRAAWNAEWEAKAARTAKLNAASKERDRRAALFPELLNALQHIAGSCEGRAVEVARAALALATPAPSTQEEKS